MPSPHPARRRHGLRRRPRVAPEQEMSHIELSEEHGATPDVLTPADLHVLGATAHSLTPYASPSARCRWSLAEW